MARLAGRPPDVDLPFHTVGMTGLLIITGGSRGIGAATALRAAEDGWDVCVGYRLFTSGGSTSVNDVTAIHIKGSSELNLVKKDDSWRVQERGDYPANYNEISDFILKAACSGFRIRYDSLGMPRSMLSNMFQCLIKTFNNPAVHHKIEIFSIPIFSFSQFDMLFFL